MQGIFLDRDGVINRERSNYVTCWEEFEFLPGVLDTLSQLAALNVATFIITNQSAIGRRIVTIEDVQKIHQTMLAYFEDRGLSIRDVFICPHHPDRGCGCRKPAPGMLLEASAIHNLDLTQCYFVGDSITDFQAARNCGCQSILVRSGLQGPSIETLLADCYAADEPGRITDVPILNDLSAAVKFLSSIR